MRKGGKNNPEHLQPLAGHVIHSLRPEGHFTASDSSLVSLWSFRAADHVI